VTRPILTILLVLVALLTACGRKGPVRPLEKPLPAAVGGLAATQKGERLLIVWSLPAANQDGSPLTDLAGFRVFRMRYDLGRDCPECRDTSTLLATVDPEYPGAVRREGDRFYLWDGELEPGYGYQYRIVPFTRPGHEGNPALVRLPFLPPLPAPGPLAAEGHDRLVRLSWPPLTLPEGAELLGYNLYRREGEASFPAQPLNRAPLQDVLYDDLGVENGRTYHYAIAVAYRSGGATAESLLSEPAAATPEAGR
jgi:hypothetical protein